MVNIAPRGSGDHSNPYPDGRIDMPGDLKYHNRLDLFLGSENFTDSMCGSTHGGTGKPHYCSFDCPVLKGTEKQKMPKTALQIEKEALVARLAELEHV